MEGLQIVAGQDLVRTDLFILRVSGVQIGCNGNEAKMQVRLTVCDFSLLLAIYLR